MKIALVGDVMLGRLVNERIAGESPAFPWGDTLPVLGQADLRIGNLECVLADEGKPSPGKVFHFRSDSRNVECLTRAGISLVSLANNHVLDYGEGALLDMLATLDQRGILHAGAGVDRSAAQRPAIWHGGETTVGFLAITDNEPGWEATERAPGVYTVPIDAVPIDDAAAADRVARLLRQVRRLSTDVDLTIVSAHWGGNWGADAPQEHRVLARSLIDAGADVVYGHSPHVVRGVEVYRGRPILYSAGDFVDDYAVDPIERNDQACIIMLETRGGVPHELRLHPTVIVDFQARLAGARARSIGLRLHRLSRQLGTRSSWRDEQSCLVIPLDEELPAG